MGDGSCQYGMLWFFDTRHSLPVTHDGHGSKAVVNRGITQAQPQLALQPTVHEPPGFVHERELAARYQAFGVGARDARRMREPAALGDQIEIVSHPDRGV